MQSQRERMCFPCFWVIMIVISLIDTAHSGEANFMSDVTHVVTNAQSVTSARSRVDCGGQCLLFSHCVSWAFHIQSSTCYLHPTVGADPGDGQGLRVYTNNAPKCSESGAPIVSGTNVTWERTLTSLRSVTSVQGTCTPDYIGDLAPARCLETGQWETGQCKQKIWRNFTWAQYYTYTLPRTPSVGWSMCLKATAFGQTAFSLNLLTNTGYVGFHCSVRFNSDGTLRTTALDTNVGGWVTYAVYLRDPNPPFPFTVGQQFDLKITAVRDNVYEVYVGGSLYGTSRPLPASVNTCNRVQLRGDPLQVDTLDIYCNK